MKHDTAYSKQDAANLLEESTSALLHMLKKLNDALNEMQHLTTNLLKLQKALLYLFNEDIENDTEWEKSTYE